MLPMFGNMENEVNLIYLWLENPGVALFLCMKTTVCIVSSLGFNLCKSDITAFLLEVLLFSDPTFLLNCQV